MVGLQKERVLLRYIILIEDTYDRAVTSVRTKGGITSEFFYYYRLASRINVKSVSFCISDG